MLSCSKDGDVPPTPDPQEAGFDIHDPVGHFMLLNFKDSSIEEGTTETLRLYQFLPDNLIHSLQLNFPDASNAYEVMDENTISIPEDRIRIMIVDDEITKVTIQGEEINGTFHLIKSPAQNILPGNTYTGSYRLNEATIIHPHFFYGFHKDGLKVDAGFEKGTVLRTDNYESIGNFAAYIETPNINDPTLMDQELLIWVGGKLEANYYDDYFDFEFYGTFTDQ